MLVQQWTLPLEQHELIVMVNIHIAKRDILHYILDVVAQGNHE